MTPLCRSVAFAALLASPLAAQPADDLTPSGDPAPLPAVRLVEPADALMPQRRAFFGRVAARETVDLSFEVGGRLEMLDAPEGSRLPEGTVIARLDAAPFERAVERAELALAQATRDAERAQTLASREVAADTLALDAATARDLADVSLREARDALDDTRMRAPFDGLVAERLSPPFVTVAPGQPIVRLHDMSEMRVEIEVPERVVATVGGIEALRFEGRRADGRTAPLTLAEFEATTGRVGQSFRVSLRLPPTFAGDLLPGKSMTVVAARPDTADGLALPVGALLPNAARGFDVMVFEPDDPQNAESGTFGHVRRHPVEVESPGGTAFRVTGLPADARVVAAGGHLLSDGTRVRVYTGLTVQEP